MAIARRSVQESADDDLLHKVEFLQQADVYPEPTSAVESRETHMSWIFLTDDHAYKLKKPMHTALLDFSTVAARRHYCLEEVRLNRRLTSNVYRAVVPLSMTEGGLRLVDDSKPVDWLVQMRRLPANAEFERLLRANRIGRTELDELARRLARFYLNQTPVSITPTAYLDGLHEDLERVNSLMSRPEYPVPSEQVRDLVLRLRRCLDRAADELTVRVRTGCIIEGHGDLRPEHIYLMPQPEIIDCIEFERRLRVLDVADELAFLALECERLGAAETGPALFRAYSGYSGNMPPAVICHIYMGYRSLIWAQLACEHPETAGGPHSGQWKNHALNYLQLAERHIAAAEQVDLKQLFA